MSSSGKWNPYSRYRKTICESKVRIRLLKLTNLIFVLFKMNLIEFEIYSGKSFFSRVIFLKAIFGMNLIFD